MLKVIPRPQVVRFMFNSQTFIVLNHSHNEIAFEEKHSSQKWKKNSSDYKQDTQYRTSHSANLLISLDKIEHFVEIFFRILCTLWPTPADKFHIQQIP